MLDYPSAHLREKRGVFRLFLPATGKIVVICAHDKEDFFILRMA
jgi:hypothetical protein